MKRFAIRTMRVRPCAALFFALTASAVAVAWPAPAAAAVAMPARAENEGNLLLLDARLDQHVLSNHSFGSHNVNATYISQHIDHLSACADKIDKGIARRIKQGPEGTAKKRRRGHMRLVA